MLESISYALNVLQRRLLSSSIIQLGRSAVGVTGDVLRHLQIATMLQIVGDARRPKTMATEVASDARR